MNARTAPFLVIFAAGIVLAYGAMALGLAGIIDAARVALLVLIGVAISIPAAAAYLVLSQRALRRDYERALTQER